MKNKDARMQKTARQDELRTTLLDIQKIVSGFVEALLFMTGRIALVMGYEPHARWCEPAAISKSKKGAWEAAQKKYNGAVVFELPPDWIPKLDAIQVSAGPHHAVVGVKLEGDEKFRIVCGAIGPSVKKELLRTIFNPDMPGSGFYDVWLLERKKRNLREYKNDDTRKWEPYTHYSFICVPGAIAGLRVLENGGIEDWIHNKRGDSAFFPWFVNILESLKRKNSKVSPRA